MRRLLLLLKSTQIPQTLHISRRSSTSSPSVQLKVGDKATVLRRFSSEDVQMFADLSGDHNPIHLNDEYASKTRYKQRIVHGVLTVGLLSGILGMTFPGPGSVILSYQMQYPAALHIDEEVKAEVEVQKIEGRKVTFGMKCTVEEKNKVVCKGSSLLLVPRDRVSSTNYQTSDDT